MIKLKSIFPKINFIGNKEKIANWICEQFPQDAKSMFDVFAGGNSVSFFAKKKGLRVIANDILKVNYLISKSLIENKSDILNYDDIDIIFKGVPVKDFMYDNYANKFFFTKECMQLDLYRSNIDKLDNQYKQALAFILLRRAMIRKMPYSRFNLDWDKIQLLRDENYSYCKYKRKRAYHNLTFKEHFLDNLEDYNNAVFDNNKENKALNDDAFNLLGKIKADILYLDPPYTGTMNNYFSFYGIFDSYIDREQKKPFDNNFINKQKALILFDTIFSKAVKYKYIILSYNNGSYPTKEELMKIINRYFNNVEVIEKEHMYKLTGKENKTKNKEYLFIITNK